ncbi:hypothetical protein Psi02_37430 [Planotetraspora silvatica]|uniref:Uncharacterized protein n=1 Tax=Planotetraspora silvatica TaxID=234614 RepID=A0A8J3UK69_9ACTN|nr:hypothetical protein Psi02_37430 [Planotetraspora silvatica]
MGQEVAEEVVDVISVLAGLVDAGRVEVDAGDVRHDLPEFAGEHALAAADIEGVLSAIGDRAQDAGVVMDVVVPPPAVLLCHVIILPDTGA